MDDYYAKLRARHVEISIEHFKNLHPELIKSPKLRELFCECYQVYFPFEDDKVMATCPWIPLNLIHKKYKSNSHGLDDPYSKRFRARIERYKEQYGPFPRIPKPGVRS